MRRSWLVMGLLVIMLALFAACDTGDDDDDADLDTGDVTEAVGEATQQEEATEADLTEGTATTDTGMATEEEAVTTGTEVDGGAVTGTEEEGTPDEDAGMTSTEEEDEATATEEETGTAAETEEDGTAEAEGTAEETEAEGTAAEGEGGLGEPIEVGDDLVLTVEDASVLDATAIGEFGEILGLEEGNQFLGVSVRIENAGSEPLALTEVFGRMRLEDADGEEYGVDLGATALALLSGEFDNISQIEAGDEVPVMVGFQVPEDVQPDDLTLVIQPEDETGEAVEVPLGGGGS